MPVHSIRWYLKAVWKLFTLRSLLQKLGKDFKNKNTRDSEDFDQWCRTIFPEVSGKKHKKHQGTVKIDLSEKKYFFDQWEKQYYKVETTLRSTKTVANSSKQRGKVSLHIYLNLFSNSVIIIKVNR